MHSPDTELVEKGEQNSWMSLCLGWIVGFNLKGLQQLLNLFRQTEILYHMHICDESAAVCLKPQLVSATTFRISCEVLWGLTQYTVNFVSWSSMTSCPFFFCKMASVLHCPVDCVLLSICQGDNFLPETLSLVIMA